MRYSRVAADSSNKLRTPWRHATAAADWADLEIKDHLLGTPVNMWPADGLTLHLLNFYYMYRTRRRRQLSTKARLNSDVYWRYDKTTESG